MLQIIITYFYNCASIFFKDRIKDYQTVFDAVAVAIGTGGVQRLEQPKPERPIFRNFEYL